MASVHLVRTSWTGFIGAPGVTTMAFDSASAPPVAAIRTFFNSLNTYLPQTVKIQVPSTGVTVDTGTGKAIGTWSAATTAVMPGIATGDYASAVGAVVNWRSGVFVNGRELRGKTFLVPIIGGAFDTDGTFDSAVVTGIQTAADTLRTTATSMRIYSRRYASSSTVASVNVPDMAVVLRSRRD